jgi:hypothetical protein
VPVGVLGVRPSNRDGPLRSRPRAGRGSIELDAPLNSLGTLDSPIAGYQLPERKGAAMFKKIFELLTLKWLWDRR